MHEMIERIIEMDKTARSLTEEAQTLKINAEKEIEVKKQNMRKEYLERAEQKIRQLRDDENANSEAEIEAFRKKSKEVKSELNKSYNENREKWVNELFAMITGR